jgi:hypothetical protein
MKTQVFWMALISILGMCWTTCAQTYTRDWSVIGGGVGTASSASYSVTTTFGQVDAGHTQGGVYAADAGFWSLLAVHPVPMVIRGTAPSPIVIAWPAPATGWFLQTSATLAGGGSWSNAGMTPVQAGDEMQVTITLPASTAFYRLAH